MIRRATLVIDRKETLEDGSILQAEVWKLPIPLKGSLHRYKYRLYFGRQGECLVRLTMNKGRAITSTLWASKAPYVFRDIPTLLIDFRDELKRAGGRI